MLHKSIAGDRRLDGGASADMLEALYLGLRLCGGAFDLEIERVLAEERDDRRCRAASRRP